MHLGSIGAWRFINGITPQMAEELEALGYGAIWAGGSPKGDLVAIEGLIEATEKVPVVTGIVHMWHSPAEQVVTSYRRIQDRHPGRLLLGVGIGHRETTEGYEKPMETIHRYLDALEQGGVPTDRIVLAALGPKALRIAAERTLGAHPYLTSPRHTRYAREVIGEGPLLAPEQKVIISSDAEAARAAGRDVISRYLARANYRNNLAREGWTEADMADRGSDALVDALVVHGRAVEVAEAVRGHLEAGADHVGVQAVGDDPMPVYRELAPLLLG